VIKLFATRGRIVTVGLAAVMVLAGGGTAFAFFTATGSGTGTATVGSGGSWSVSQSSASGTMYPGSGNTTITFTVTNNGSGDQSYSNATAAVNSSTEGGYITESGTPVSGCDAGWFSALVTNANREGANIGTGGSFMVTVKVTMPSDPSDDQDACQGKTPDVNLSIS